MMNSYDLTFGNINSDGYFRYLVKIISDGFFVTVNTCKVFDY